MKVKNDPTFYYFPNPLLVFTPVVNEGRQLSANIKTFQRSIIFIKHYLHYKELKTFTNYSEKIILQFVLFPLLCAQICFFLSPLACVSELYIKLNKYTR